MDRMSLNFCSHGMDVYSGNLTVTDTTMDDTPDEDDRTVAYRIIATFLHVVIFLCGLFGNIVLIIVARRCKELQTPTYSYLVSLAFADLIVLISAVPDAILFHHIGIRFPSGPAGCSLMIFGNFLGINAGSLSILAFTMERYVAVVHPLEAQKVCTVERANKVIVAVWLFAILYCSPWLGLTRITYPYLDNPELPICDFRLSKDQYVYFFSADLLLFYVLPLVVCAFVYIRIWFMFREQKYMERSGSFYSRASYSNNSLHTPPCHPPPRLNSCSFPQSVMLNGTAKCKAKTGERSKIGSFIGLDHLDRNLVPSAVDGYVKPNYTALMMLVVVVVLFAVCWLPFRGLLVYNSFASTPWLDLWYLLFAKTLIYINSAINPFLYNAMSAKFRSAVYRTLHVRRIPRDNPTQSFAVSV